MSTAIISYTCGFRPNDRVRLNTHNLQKYSIILIKLKLKTICLKNLNS